MKTNIRMLRPLVGVDVQQRTDTGFISMNALLKAGNKQRVTDGQPPKDRLALAEYLRNGPTQELIEQIKFEENITKIKIAGRGRSATTWIHPVLALDFALWLSPKLKYEVYSWIKDQLLIKRMESGDANKAVNKALDDRYNIGSKYWYYANVANAIREACGVPYCKGDPWCNATEDQLSLRTKIQDDIILLCEIHPTMTLENLVQKAIDRRVKNLI